MNAEIKCPICKNGKLIPYKNRNYEKCDSCGAKGRHRVGFHLYQSRLSHLKGAKARCLHMAPERPFFEILSSIFAGGYLPADPRPAKYPHAKVLKLFFPDGYSIFPEAYFDVILHNHVLEHIPGHYKDHIELFLKLLKPGGEMIFSVPGPYLDKETVEGGELEASDSVRLEKFFQEDHLKIFGADFVEHIKMLSSADFIPDGITDELRSKLFVRPGKAPFFILKKKPI